MIQAGTFLTLMCGHTGPPPVEGTRRNTVFLTDHLDRGVVLRSKDPLSLIACIVRPFSRCDSHSRNPGEVLQVRCLGEELSDKWPGVKRLHFTHIDMDSGRLLNQMHTDYQTVLICFPK